MLPPLNYPTVGANDGRVFSSAVQLVAVRRSLNAASGEPCSPLARQQLLPSEGSIKVTELVQLDGQYAVLVEKLGNYLE